LVSFQFIEERADTVDELHCGFGVKTCDPRPINVDQGASQIIDVDKA